MGTTILLCVFVSDSSPFHSTIFGNAMSILPSADGKATRAHLPHEEASLGRVTTQSSNSVRTRKILGSRESLQLTMYTSGLEFEDLEHSSDFQIGHLATLGTQVNPSWQSSQLSTDST
jgi:hypothetical protein